jgi:4-hydroxy-2-oxoheptanedioate aldolase
MNEPNAGPDAIRHRWRPGSVTLGGWCAIGNSYSAELMGRAGFDWVCVDQQHGMVGPDALVPMLQALSLTRTPAFVRVPWNEPASIMRALDAGAQGLVIPLVNTPADAAAAVSAARYPPLGDRSWGPARPLHEIDDYSPELGNRRVIVAVQIETVRAVSDVDAILSVVGVDAAFVGPSDLALSAGWEPTLIPRRPEHRNLIMQVMRSAHEHGMPAGIYCGSAEMAAAWRDAGFEMLAVSSDAIILKSGAVDAVRRLRNAEAARARQTGTIS